MLLHQTTAAKQSAPNVMLSLLLKLLSDDVDDAKAGTNAGAIMLAYIYSEWRGHVSRTGSMLGTVWDR